MIIPSRISKSIYTLIFLAFAMIVAKTIPVHSLVNNDIFYEDRTKIFDLSAEQFKIFRSEGFILSNILNNPAIVYQKTPPVSTLYDLYLGFDGNDFTNNYYTIKSSYKTNNSKRTGRGVSAKFVSQNDNIVLFPNNNSILYNSVTSLQSFTISFTLYPYRVGEGTQTILRYLEERNASFEQNKLYGFQITIENGIVKYQFHNFFVDEMGKHYSFILTERTPLIDQQWEQHTVIVDTINHTIKIYRNEQEIDVRMITQNQKTSGRRLKLSPESVQPANTTPLMIGQNGIFALDELVIYKDIVTNFMIYTPNQMKFFETDVFPISKNFSWLYEMNIIAPTNTNDFYRLAYRFDTNYFLPETSSNTMPWVYINPAKKKFPPSKSMGKFLQWRLEYYTPPTPSDDIFYVRNLSTSYRENSYPGTIFIDDVKAGDTVVEISWQTLPSDLVSSYEIYYGNKSLDYFGEAKISPPSPIILNTIQSSSTTNISYIIEGLENEQPYYISIRAKDIYGQYGAYSSEILARPSSINNYFDYSIGR